MDENLVRHSGGPVCLAPSVSMYFEVDGSVLACCQNVLHPLGDVRRDPLDDIWSGPAATELRRRLADSDLTHGCRSCAAELATGERRGALAAGFDDFTVGNWPRRLEFALSNHCNLACVMCNGRYSSRIRAEREHLPPLRPVYGESFFDQLRPFLRHVEQCRFFGGEPFLVTEYHRIWELMIEEGSVAECNVTTNGTVRTPNVEAVLDALPFSIGVSLDGTTSATVERIRQGASFERVMANIRWFAERCAARGTVFGLTFCLMTENWEEFTDFLLLAEDLGAHAAVNRVVQPSRFSLHHLDADDLATIVTTFDHRADELCDRLSEHNRSVWQAQLASLRQQLDRTRAFDGGARPDLDATRVLQSVLDHGPFEAELDLVAAVETVAGGRASGVRAGSDGVLTGTVNGEFFGVPEAEIAGRPMSAVAAILGRRFGGTMTMIADLEAEATTARLLCFDDGATATTILVVAAALGRPVAQIHVGAMLGDRASEVPVALNSFALGDNRDGPGDV